VRVLPGLTEAAPVERAREPRPRRRRLRPGLRPLPSRKLPADLRAGAVGSIATTLPRGVHDPAFEVLLRRIDRGPVLAGNQVDVFDTGNAAFAAMQAAAAAAREEILLESYIFKDDEVGSRFLEIAAAAARRGVMVRVLADAAGSQATHRSFWGRMEEAGIEVRLFDLLQPRLWWLQPFRDHRKLLVVDRRIAFTGGMNIGEEYRSSHPMAGGGWRDTHIRVEGPTAWEMAVLFCETWRRAGGRAMRFEPLFHADRVDVGAQVLLLDSRPGRGHRESAAVLAAIAGAARQRLWITNPYFAPGRLGLRVVGEASRRGVDVRLLLPGVADVPVLQRAARGYYGDLLESGVRIFEYQGAVLHAKSLVADGHVSVVGSTNLDFRSFLFNAECNLVVLDARCAERVEEIFRHDLARSREVTTTSFSSRRALDRLADRTARWLSPLL